MGDASLHRMNQFLDRGFELHDYILEEPIGQGGMGVVYRALDQRLNRSVAVKVLNEEAIDLEGLEGQFLEEARSAAAVDHPNVLPIFSFGKSDRIVYMVSRLVRGGDLTTVMPELHQDQVSRTLRILRQAAAAIDAVHLAQVLHLDVKPSNLLLEPLESDEGEHLYLADFGLSFLAKIEGGELKDKLFGTPEYMAPEYIMGQEFDGCADVFALACVAFQCLSGRTPFGIGSIEETLFAQVNRPVPPLGGRLGRGEVDEVFAMALARDPEFRFQSASAFVTALQSALGKS